GGDCEYTNLDLTRALLEILGKSDSLVRFVTDRPGHDRRYALDSSKIKQELSWRPTIPFLAGLHETVQWYQQNLEWLRLPNTIACRKSASSPTRREEACV